MRVVAVLSLALCTALASPRAAQAQAVATTQFRDAKQAYDDGEYEQAMQMFQVAWEYSHSPNARLYIARCFIKLGNFIAAADELRGTMRDADEKTAEDPKYGNTRDAAAAELVLLEHKIGYLLVIVDDAVPNVSVSMNDKPLPAVQLGERITLLPGRVELVARAKDRPDVTRTIDVKPGRTEAVTLFFPRAAAPGDEPVPEPVTPPDDGLSLVQWLGVGVIGVGALGLATAAASGAAAGGKFGALEQACGDDPCPPGFEDVIDSGKTWELVAYISGGAGLAAVLGGTAMILFGGDASEQAAFVPLPGGGFASYRLSF